MDNEASFLERIAFVGALASGSLLMIPAARCDHGFCHDDDGNA